MSALVAPSGECLRSEGLLWLTEAVVCSLAVYRGFNCSLARAGRSTYVNIQQPTTSICTQQSTDCSKYQNELQPYGDRSFAVQGPRVWNSLPAELSTPDILLDTFRNRNKKLIRR